MKPARRFPIVGIGSSAGGLEATGALLKGLRPDCGMALVVIQHLSPDFESQLPEILGRSTRMKVVPATNGARVVANCVFVIPPNKSLRIQGGKLRLRSRAAGYWNSIDEFFTSLARDQGERAVGVVLSGEASDGTQGLLEIKATGGLTFAQSPASASHSSMPSSAISSGAVDFVLPPDEIARELKRIGKHRLLYASDPDAASRPVERALQEVFAILRAKKGADFSGYRRSSIMRRIQRRMAIKRLPRLEAYAEELKRDPAEAAALLDDLLIQVTSFFRDPEAFKALKTKVYPALLGKKRQREPIRLWIAGCSTGEEAYSHLINMLEYVGDRPVPIQVFATDLSDRALDTARLGIYPARIEDEMPPDRLRKYFVKASGGYQVRKPLRDLCVFARHNIITDPPFGNLDLVSCRNVLIYFDSVTQQRILPMFHYTLKPGGVLMLGSSEGIGEFHDRFAVINKSMRLYSKKSVPVRIPFDFNPRKPLPEGVVRKAEKEMTHRPETIAVKADLHSTVERILLDRYSPAGVVVDKHFDIVFSKGDTSPYLGLSGGRPILNLLKMARVDLVVELRALLEQARKAGGAVTKEGLQIKRDGQVRSLTLQAAPVPGAEPLTLVLFVEAPFFTSERRSQDENRQLAKLKQELTSTREYMRKISQEQDTSSEEVRAANEEILASNEELQSTNEELQIAKEELQSANEEMSTVNEELSVRNGELNSLSNDLANVLNSVQLPIVMLGNDLHIRRLTPTAEKILGLLPAHIGKNITDVPMSVSISGLEKLLNATIDTISVQTTEARDRQGRSYQVTARPYLTGDKKIDGAVLTLLDVTDRQRSLLAHKERQDQAEAIVNTVIGPLAVLDDHLKIISGNRAFCEMFGIDERSSKGEQLLSLKVGRWNSARLVAQLDSLVNRGKPFTTFEFEASFRGRGAQTFRATARLLEREGSHEVLLAMEDITARKAEADAENLRMREKMQRDFVADISHELRTPIALIKGYTETLLKEGPHDAKQSLEFLTTIDRHAGRLHDLVEDLLSLSGLESGRRSLHIQSVALRPLVQEAVDTLAPLARTKGVSIVSRVAARLLVHGDRRLLASAIRNLAENAVKYNRPKGKVEITAEAYGTELRLSVRDTGMGITKKEQARVFERFYRAKAARARDPIGNGLGLAIAKIIIESHGGRLWVSSVKGKGSTFNLTVPLRRPSAAE